MLFYTFYLVLSLAAGSAIASTVEASIEDTLIVPRQQGQTHVVVVGSLQNPNAVTFTPNSINAAKGDVVQYQFVSANHTATQASGPQAACKPAKNAINSGFMPVQQGASKVKTFSMVVQDDTQPMYMYCAAAKHCQQGMVMTINAAQADTKAFKAASKKAKNNVPAKNVSGGNAGRISTKQVGKQPAAN
ncbi:hypothetical protein IFR04_012391 [Cadophora malorum]|uniref:Extracellular serine-rich protein n=1 Tax=Cadophora malorum TaxID=108018 RepID=A0A8H7W876_9HELO|nr:hypothetical protein IFR04_012391 [Cadophora malorum]